MPRMTPRKYAKLPFIREAWGSRCEELARLKRADAVEKIVAATRSEVGDILSLVSKEGDVPLVSETCDSRGIITRHKAFEKIEHGAISMIPREDGSAHWARAVVVPRLYGYRKAIIEQVQREIEAKDGVRMSADWIKACWDDFCALHATLESDLRAEKD